MMFECFNCINVTEVSEDEFLKAIISGESRLHGYCKKEAPSLGPLGGGGIFAILEAARCGF
jgi:hypothetical protein